MDEKYCQSCGMPMGETDEMYGTNADGSKNEEYCQYCFADGKFVQECTMEEMIEFCIPHMAEANTGMSEQDAKAMMLEFFPTLSRWKKN